MRPVIQGRALSPAEQQQLSDLQSLFKPADAMKRIDDFSKWVFASIAVVGTLGAGFSNSAFATLAGPGKILFAAAVVLVGASLLASTLALEPAWVHVNLSSRYSMLHAVNENLRKRKRPVQLAAVLFGFAIATAASAPLVSAFTSGKEPRLVLSYDLKPDGKFTGIRTGTGLRPFAVLELRLEGGSGSKLWLAPSVRKSADEQGAATLSVDLANARDAGSQLRLSEGWADLPLDLIKEPLSNQQTLNIRLPPPPPGSERPKPSSAKSENETPEKGAKKSDVAANEKRAAVSATKVPDRKPRGKPQ